MEAAQILDLRLWWLNRMMTAQNPLREKMTLFWHSHFATSMQKVNNCYWMWLQNETLRRNALGNFKSLTRQMSRDPAMMIYLDLQESRKEHPNENWARELMELFTVGIGHYSEQDIRESARAFTGYRLDMTTQDFQFAAGLVIEWQHQSRLSATATIKVPQGSANLRFANGCVRGVFKVF